MLQKSRNVLIETETLGGIVTHGFCKEILWALT